MNSRSKQNSATRFTESRTIPGQSLTPAELLKRHLSGTLPPIDLSNKYEFHYDETGKQIAEPLPLEMHEMHKLSVAIRKRQFEEATELRKQNAEKHKAEIIEEHERLQAEKSKLKPVDKTDPGEGAAL